MTLGIIVRTCPYSNQNLDTVYEISKRALQKGHKVMIFFYEDAVLALNKNIKSPGERNIAERMLELGTLGVTLFACGLCARFRGLPKDSIIDGAKMAGMAVMAKLINESDQIITFNF